MKKTVLVLTCLVFAAAMASCSFITARRTGNTEYFFKDAKKIAEWKHGENGKVDRQGEDITGVVHLEDENAKLLEKTTYKAGVKDGKWESYYPDGSMMESGEYKDGKKTGEWTKYYKGARVESVQEYEEGLPEGFWLCRYEGGEVKETGEFVKGEAEGYWKCNYQSGVLMSEGAYKEGKKEGVWREYYDSGTEKTHKIYEQGRMIWGKVYDKGGNLVEELKPEKKETITIKEQEAK